MVPQVSKIKVSQPVLCVLQSGQRPQIGADDRQPHITAKSLDPLPVAAIKSQAAFDPGNDRLDSGSEVAKTFIYPVTAAHVYHFQTSPFSKANVFNPQALDSLQIVFGSETAIKRRFKWITAVNIFLPLDHLHRQGGIGRVPGGNKTVRDQLRRSDT